MKVIVTGANGQLGSALVKNAPAGFEIIPLTRKNFDLRETDRLKQFLQDTRPDVVINTAAFHNTERCEEMPKDAMIVNSMIPSFMADMVGDWGGIFAFISTDYVFNGQKRGEPYYEDDEPDPINIYGLSKNTGEYGVKLLNSRNYIFRTSSLFGKTSKPLGNFVLRILDRARRENILRVVNDIFITPSYTNDVSLRIWEVIQNKSPFGIYHIANSGTTSWFDFAVEIVELAGLKVEVIPISYQESNSKLRRPKWSPLGSKKLPPLRHWKEALKEYMDEL